VGVSGGGFDLEDSLVNGQEGHVEGSSSKVEDKDVLLALVAFLVETLSDGGCGRLVDDSEHVESGNGTCVLGSLALRVVELSRDGHDCVLYGCSKVVLRNLLHLGQNHG
jgi:hypothetical protein